MKKGIIASAAILIALAAVAPAFAGGAGCQSHASASTASGDASCHSKSANAAWAGAWLQRSPSGQIVVADVAKGSPASKAGLKSGDVVLAVNGYNLSDSKQAAMCAASAECEVGSTISYTVKRGQSKKNLNLKLKLEQMPADATSRFAARDASYDPTLAAIVIPTTVD